MRAGEGELRPDGVVELNSLPLNCRVALCTVFREPGADMIRLGSPVERIQVAALTALGCPLEGAADMALVALRVDVAASQRESCLARMVERRARPLGS